MGQSLQPGYDLVITNGDVAGGLLRKAIPNTEVLPWRDVLHDGPVPLTGSGEELDEIRADFLADQGWGDRDEIRQAFEARRNGLAHNATFNRVVLWFEHDLFDQLQLLQVLDWFARHPREGGTLLLVQCDEFLGTQSPETIAEWQRLEQPVSEAQLALAQRAWSAYRQETPSAWAGLLRNDTAALPHLRAAVLRALQELPCAVTGLSRTQSTILQLVSDGTPQAGKLFGAAQAQEEAAFMGDWSFWTILDGLAAETAPLLEGFASGPFTPRFTHEEFTAYLESELTLTRLGEEVLSGQEDYLDHAPVSRWMGGSHITNDNAWRWDNDGETLVPPV